MRHLGPLAVAAIVVTYAIFAATHLGGYRWNFDEGITVHKAWLMLEGFRLYEEIWADQPPGHAVLVMAAFKAVGVSLWSARMVSVTHALTGLTGAAWAARELCLAYASSRRLEAHSAATWLAAVAAAAMLVLAPNFFWASRAAMIGLNTFSLATFAMAAAMTYARTARRRWLLVASLSLGFALWEKLQMAYLLPLFALVSVAVNLRPRHAPDNSLAHRRPWTARRSAPTGPPGVLVDWLATAVFAGAPLLLSLVYFDPAAMIEQAWGTYLSTRGTYPVDLLENSMLLRTWVTRDNLGLAAVAAVGIVFAVRQRSLVGWVGVLWAALTVGTALQHAPLWLEDHFEPLMFALAALAGSSVGIAFLEGRWARLSVALALAIYAAALPHQLEVNSQLLRARDYENDGRVLTHAEWREHRLYEEALLAAAQRIHVLSEPDEFVFVDDQIIAFLARRHVPPELAAMSSRRIRLEEISGSELIRLTELYRPPVVVAWKAQFSHYDSYVEWLNVHYERDADIYGHPVYVAPGVVRTSAAAEAWALGTPTELKLTRLE